MGWPKEHKQATRDAIVEAASSLFTQYGFERVGIDEVMGAAGLTRGSFYAHFRSKSELYAEAIVAAALRAREHTLAGAQTGGAGAMVKRYLQRERADDGDNRCPLAFLTTDIHQREPQVRTAYTRVFQGFVQTLAQSLGCVPESDEALQKAVLMVGGLAIARALNDEAMSEQVLAACERGVEAP